MASNALQVVGFVLGVMAWVGMIGTCAAPQWRKNSLGQTVIDNTLRYDGLWLRCKAFSTGQTQCDPYTSFFIGLPEVLQICRALMISSIGIGFIATLVTIFGLKCVNAGCGSSKVKSRISLIGGLLYGVAAILNGAAVSYFAHGVVQEYYNPVLEEDYPKYLRFEYGYALFIGWASLVVGVIASALVCGSSVVMLARKSRSPPSVTPHVHELRPVPIVPTNNLPAEHVPMQMYRGAQLPQPRDSINARQVRIQHPKDPGVVIGNNNGVARQQSSASSGNKPPPDVARAQQQKRGRNQRPRDGAKERHKYATEGRRPEPSTRAKRRRSYEEESMRRSRATGGQIKQYV